jgi:hypothetical protein
MNSGGSMERCQLIEKLVSTLHLNVDERRSLGSEPVRKAEVASVIARSLAENGRFPRHAKQWAPGKLAFEGFFIEMSENGIARLWLQRHAPINPYRLAAQRHWDFSTPDEAINEFITREWSNGGIDGIKLL